MSREVVAYWPRAWRKIRISTGRDIPVSNSRYSIDQSDRERHQQWVPKWYHWSAQGARDDNTQLDRAGHTILQLLNKAADGAEQNSRHAIDTAQRLSHHLRAAEDRIAELEAEVEAYRQQAERAEQWLYKVYTEIEDRFLDRDKNARRRA
jgi:hypothetical protein